MDKYIVNEFVEEKIYEHILGEKTKSSKKINFRCPFCGDSKKSKKKKRGWYNKETLCFYCYNCNLRLSATKFVAALENKPLDEVKKVLLKRNLTLEPRAKLFEQTEKKVIVPNSKISIKLEWVDLNKSPEASSIIQRRKILEAPFIPKNWKLYFDTKTNRIVIPWIRKGEMVYYQLRSIYKDDPVKYLFPEDVPKDILGLDNIDETFPYLFLVEGAFDSIFIKNGIAIGGVFLTEYQRKLLEPYTNFKLVWFFDNQYCDQTGYEKSIEKLNKKESVFIWDPTIKEKDANDYILSKNENPFQNSDFLLQHVCDGAKGLLKLKFRR